MNRLTKTIYDGLRERDAFKGDYSAFEATLQDDNVRKKLYRQLAISGILRNRSYDEFTADLGVSPEPDIPYPERVPEGPTYRTPPYDPVEAARMKLRNEHASKKRRSDALLDKMRQNPQDYPGGSQGMPKVLPMFGSSWDKITVQGEDLTKNEKEALQEHYKAEEQRLHKMAEDEKARYAKAPSRLEEMPWYAKITYPGGMPPVPALPADVAGKPDFQQSMAVVDNLKKAADTYAAPTTFGDEWWITNVGRGIGNVVSDKDFLTRGLTEGQRQLTELGVKDKMNRILEDAEREGWDEETTSKKMYDALTDTERRLYASTMELMGAQAARSADTSLGYQAGQALAESAGYMLDFYLSGKLLNASPAFRNMTARALRSLHGRIAKDGGKALSALSRAEKAAYGAGKFGIRAADASAQTALRTAMFPSTYNEVLNNRLEVDEKGRYVNSWASSLANGYTDSFLENLSEMSGPMMTRLLKFGGQGAKATAKFIASPVLKSKPVRRATEAYARKIRETGLSAAAREKKVLADALAKAGYYGPVEEYMEEVFNAVMMTAKGYITGNEEDKRQFGQFWTFDNNAVLVPTVMLPGAVTSTYNVIANRGAIKAQRQKEKTYSLYPWLRNSDEVNRWNAHELREKVNASTVPQGQDKSQGRIQQVQLTDGRTVYVTQGQLAFNIDNTVDGDNSADGVTVMDSKGRKSVVSTKGNGIRVEKLVSDMPYNTEKLYEARQNEREARARYNYSVGKEVRFSDPITGDLKTNPDGSPATGTIIGIGDGVVRIDTHDPTLSDPVMAVSYSDLESGRWLVPNRDGADMKAPEGGAYSFTVDHGDGRRETVTVEGVNGDGTVIASLRDKDGNFKGRETMTRARLEWLEERKVQDTQEREQEQEQQQPVTTEERQPQAREQDAGQQDATRTGDAAGDSYIVVTREGHDYTVQPMRYNGDGTVSVRTYDTATGNILQDDTMTLQDFDALRAQAKEVHGNFDTQQRQEQSKSGGVAGGHNMGDTFAFTDEDGDNYVVEITAANPDGTFDVSFTQTNGTHRMTRQSVTADALDAMKLLTAGNSPSPIGAQAKEADTRQENLKPIGRPLSEEEADALLTEMEAGAETAPEMELTPENWVSQFGDDGMVQTPLGTVKMGDNQYLKFAQKGRSGKLGMVKPTLENPDVIVEDKSFANESQKTERASSYVFIKAFKKADGSRYYLFTSVTVSKDGKEVVISNQEKSSNKISKLLQNGKIAWIKESSLHPMTQDGKPVSLNDSNKSTTSGNQPAMLGINSSANSTSKDTQSSQTTQDPVQEIADGTVSLMGSVQAAQKAMAHTIADAQKKLADVNRKIEAAEVVLTDPKSVKRYKDLQAQAQQLRQTIDSYTAAMERLAQPQAQPTGDTGTQEDATPEDVRSVPLYTEEDPKQGRTRGWRKTVSDIVRRPERVAAAKGGTTRVKFSTDTEQEGVHAVIEADELQPSHQQGVKNPYHFLDEAQPKDREGKDSVVASRKIAAGINPQEITGGVTAYTGSPSVNARGEVLQGNNRADALIYMYANEPEAAARYKQYLVEHADEFGLDAEKVASMSKPVLVNMLDVSDDRAIELGQLTSSDLESGGTQPISPSNVANQLASKGLADRYAGMLLRGEEDESISELVVRNGREALVFLRNVAGVINDTQYRSALREDGELTPEARVSLADILTMQLLGGNKALRTMFGKLPAKAQKAIMATAYRDSQSNEADRMQDEIRASIIAFNSLMEDADFAKATNYEDARRAMEAAKRQMSWDFAANTQAALMQRFSNFALTLAAMYKGSTQRQIQATFNDIYNYVQGTGQMGLFDAEAPRPHSLEEAIRHVLELDYQPKNKQYYGNTRSDNVGGNSPHGEAGGQGSPRDVAIGEQGEAGERPADGGRGTDEDGGQEEVTSGLFQYFTGTLSELISQAKQSAQGLIKKVIAPISSRLKEDLENQGIKIDDSYNHVIDNNAIRHTLKKHSGKDEEKRGQIPVTETDFEYLADVVENYDAVEVVPSKTSAQRIIYHKAYPDGTVVYVEEQRVGRKELAAVSMWKKKNPNLTGANRTETMQIPDSTEVSSDKDTKNPETTQQITDAVEKLGLGVEIITSPSQLPKEEKKAREAIEKGEEVKGWYNARTGKAYLYLPNAWDAADAVETVLHEVVAHKGLRGLLGKEGFDRLCDEVWDMMDAGQRRRFMAYVTRKKKMTETEFLAAVADGNKRREAADEYVAHIAESLDTEKLANESAWKKVLEAVRAFLGRIGIGRDANISDETIIRLLQDSYRQLRRQKEGGNPENIIKENISKAESEVNLTPTEAQKKAGNYKKGHVRIDGYDITIEQPKGSTRSGTDENGKTWETKMNNTYGYIRGTQSVDGDHIDVFLSDNPTEGNVYVVDQIDQKTGEFDEHKVMYGFNSMEEAKNAYLSNYSKGWKIGNITEVNKEEFKKWVESSHRKTKPFSEYSSVNKQKQEEKDNSARFRISNSRKEQMRQGLRTKLSDATEDKVESTIQEIEKLGESSKKGGNAKLEKAAYHWALKGTVLLPEDNDKIVQAVEMADRKNVDFMAYDSPMELINAYAGEVKAKPINPDTVDELSNKRDMGHGITVYDVEDSEDGRKAMRKIIDTHYGKDSSPWCLLQGDGDGNLTPESKDYWNHYSAYPKRVAFRDGRLLAFFASDGRPTWWDRQDYPYSGIPIIGKIDGDALGRSGTRTLDETTGQLSKPTDIHKGNKRKGTYEEWDDDGRLLLRENYKDGKLEGLRENWYENGQLQSRINYKDGQLDGVGEIWYKDGQLHARENYKKGKLDGLREEWYENGQLQWRENYKDGERNGKCESWYDNGQLQYLVTYKDGKKDGLQEEWHYIGKLRQRATYKNGEKDGVMETWYGDGRLMEREFFKDGRKNGLHDEWNYNGKLLYRKWYDNGREVSRDTFAEKYGWEEVERQEQPQDDTVRFRIGPDSETSMTENQRAAFDAVSSMLENAGIEVEVMTNEQMQQLAGRADAVLEARMNALDKAAHTIQNWVKGNVRGKSFSLQLPQRVRNEIRKAMGRDFESHNITANSLAHILKGHGEQGEKLTANSIPLRKEDLELIPYIMVAPDKIVKGNTDITGREGVRFYKYLSNGYVVVVEREYKNSPDDMETITMWAEKSSAATNAQSKTAPDMIVRNAIRSTDSAKIRKDAETALADDVKNIKDTKSQLIVTSNDIVYGATVGGKIYLNGEHLNPESPIHEYTHIWDAACQINNPELWKRGVELMKQTPLWEEVNKDPNYDNLTTDDEIASEVHSRLTGKDGAALLERMAEEMTDGKRTVKEAVDALSVVGRLKKWLSDFWYWLKDTMTPWTSGEAEKVSLEDFVNMPLKDLARGNDLRTDGGTEILFRIAEEEAEKTTNELREAADNATYDNAVGDSEVPVMPKPGRNTTLSDYLKTLSAWNEAMERRNDELIRGFKDEFAKNMKLHRQLYRKFVDAARPLENFQNFVVKNGGTLRPQSDAYGDLFASNGRATYKTIQFENGKWKPLEKLIKDMARNINLKSIDMTLTTEKNGKTIRKKAIPYDIISLYLRAKDILEAQSLGMVERGSTGFAEVTGMAPAEFAEMVESIFTRQEIDNLWRNIKDCTSFSLDMYNREGMLSDEKYDEFMRRGFYVPQRGWEQGQDEYEYDYDGMVRGSRFTNPLTKAEGRRSLASDPLKYIYSMATSSILATERNAVKRKFLQFIRDNISLGIESRAFDLKQVWFVKSRSTDPETGLPLYTRTYVQPSDELLEEDRKSYLRIDELKKQLSNEADPEAAAGIRRQITELRDNMNVVRSTRARKNTEDGVIRVVENGVEYEIRLNAREVSNTRGIVDVLERRSKKTNAVLRWFGRWTRKLTSMLTQYNPAFALANFTRDYLSAFVTNTVQYGLGFSVKAASNTIKVMRAVARHAVKGDYGGNGEYSGMLREFFENGGATGFTFLRDIGELEKDLRAEIGRGRLMDSVVDNYGRLKKGLAVLTEISEVSVRFGEYVTSRKQGKTIEESVRDAKEVTTNFDRKGSSIGIFSPFFGFFNASIQGSNRMYRLILDKHGKKLAAACMGFMVLGIVNTLLNPDDPDEGVSLTDYDRMSNLTIGNFKIPLPHFFRGFWGFGVQLALWMQGKKNADEFLLQGLQFLTGELVPEQLGILDGLRYDDASGRISLDPVMPLINIMPTVLQPLFEAGFNRDFTGGRIYKENYLRSMDSKIPKTQLGRDDESPAVRKLTDWLANVSGGSATARTNRDIPFWADVNPSALVHVIEGYSPGILGLVLMVGSVAVSQITGEEYSLGNYNLVGRFYRPYDEGRTQERLYWKLKGKADRFKYDADEYFKAKNAGDGNAARLYEDMATEEKAKTYNSARRLLDDLNPDKEGYMPSAEGIRKLQEQTKEWNKIIE